MPRKNQKARPGYAQIAAHLAAQSENKNLNLIDTSFPSPVYEALTDFSKALKRGVREGMSPELGGRLDGLVRSLSEITDQLIRSCETAKELHLSGADSAAQQEAMLEVVRNVQAFDKALRDAPKLSEEAELFIASEAVNFNIYDLWTNSADFEPSEPYLELLRESARQLKENGAQKKQGKDGNGQVQDGDGQDQGGDGQPAAEESEEEKERRDHPNEENGEHDGDEEDEDEEESGEKQEEEEEKEAGFDEQQPQVAGIAGPIQKAAVYVSQAEDEEFGEELAKLETFLNGISDEQVRLAGLPGEEAHLKQLEELANAGQALYENLIRTRGIIDKEGNSPVSRHALDQAGVSLDDFDTRFTAYLEAYPEDADRISGMSSYEDSRQELDLTQGYPVLENAGYEPPVPVFPTGIEPELVIATMATNYESRYDSKEQPVALLLTFKNRLRERAEMYDPESQTAKNLRSMESAAGKLFNEVTMVYSGIKQNDPELCETHMPKAVEALKNFEAVHEMYQRYDPDSLALAETDLADRIRSGPYEDAKAYLDFLGKGVFRDEDGKPVGIAAIPETPANGRGIPYEQMAASLSAGRQEDGYFAPAGELASLYTLIQEAKKKIQDLGAYYGVEKAAAEALFKAFGDLTESCIRLNAAPSEALLREAVQKVRRYEQMLQNCKAMHVKFYQTYFSEVDEVWGKSNFASGASILSVVRLPEDKTGILFGQNEEKAEKKETKTEREEELPIAAPHKPEEELEPQPDVPVKNAPAPQEKERPDGSAYGTAETPIPTPYTPDENETHRPPMFYHNGINPLQIAAAFRVDESKRQLAGAFIDELENEWDKMSPEAQESEYGGDLKELMDAVAALRNDVILARRASHRYSNSQLEFQRLDEAADSAERVEKALANFYNKYVNQLGPIGEKFATMWMTDDFPQGKKAIRDTGRSRSALAWADETKDVLNRKNADIRENALVLLAIRKLSGAVRGRKGNLKQTELSEAEIAAEVKRMKSDPMTLSFLDAVPEATLVALSTRGHGGALESLYTEFNGYAFENREYLVPSPKRWEETLSDQQVSDEQVLALKTGPSQSASRWIRDAQEIIKKSTDTKVIDKQIARILAVRQLAEAERGNRTNLDNTVLYEGEIEERASKMLEGRDHFYFDSFLTSLKDVPKVSAQGQRPAVQYNKKALQLALEGHGGALEDRMSLYMHSFPNSKDLDHELYARYKPDGYTTYNDFLNKNRNVRYCTPDRGDVRKDRMRLQHAQKMFAAYDLATSTYDKDKTFKSEAFENAVRDAGRNPVFKIMTMDSTRTALLNRNDFEAISGTMEQIITDFTPKSVNRREDRKNGDLTKHAVIDLYQKLVGNREGEELDKYLSRQSKEFRAMVKSAEKFASKDGNPNEDDAMEVFAAVLDYQNGNEVPKNSAAKASFDTSMELAKAVVQGTGAKKYLQEQINYVNAKREVDPRSKKLTYDGIHSAIDARKEKNEPALTGPGGPVKK